MTTRNVNLTAKLDDFVNSKIADGEFQNASEVIRAGLRLLSERDELRKAKISALMAAIQVGLDEFERGEFEVVDDVGAWLEGLREEARD